MHRALKPLFFGLVSLIVSHQVVLAGEREQMTNDITSVAAIVPANERAHVINYLYNGPALRSEVLTAGIGRNTLNRITRDRRVTLPLARVFHQHVVNTNLPGETRFYALARMIDLAKLDKQVETMTHTLAEEIVKHEQSPTQRLAQNYLQGDPHVAVSQVRSNYNASQFVGTWRHMDSGFKLVTDITFKADGTYSGHLIDGGKLSWSFAGKWMVEEGKLRYEYTSSSLKHIPVGSKDEDKIVEVTPKRYVIENSLDREAYVRIE